MTLLTDRILRALERGPMTDGALQRVFHDVELLELRRAITGLARAGRIYKPAGSLAWAVREGR